MNEHQLQKAHEAYVLRFKLEKLKSKVKTLKSKCK